MDVRRRDRHMIESVVVAAMREFRSASFARQAPLVAE